MKLRPGVCFQFIGEGYHLKVVVTFPDAKGDVVVFSLTGADNVEETICIFEQGEHPFFTKPTAVNYFRKWVLPAEGFDESKIKFHQPFNAGLIVRIIEAARKSEDLEPFILKLLPSAAKMQEFIAEVEKQG